MRCPYGNRNKSCETMETNLCYNIYNRYMCCATCASVRTNMPGRCTQRPRQLDLQLANLHHTGTVTTHARSDRWPTRPHAHARTHVHLRTRHTLLLGHSRDWCFPQWNTASRKRYANGVKRKCLMEMRFLFYLNWHIHCNYSTRDRSFICVCIYLAQVLWYAIRRRDWHRCLRHTDHYCTQKLNKSGGTKQHIFWICVRN